MKNIMIFLIIVLIFISGFSIIYLNYNANYNMAKKENLEFEFYYNKEIYGFDVVALINRAVDKNTKNEVIKDENQKFQNNDKNSINIDIKMIDNDITYDMETIYNGGMEKFIQYYNNIKFKCTRIDYHKQTNKIKYIFIEQITI